jgi:hypothetical protein
LESEHRKKQRKAWNAERRAEIAAFILNHKLLHPCKCGERNPRCLQFHHVDAKSKDDNLSRAAKNLWSWKKIENEMAKCKLMCANCHIKEHEKLMGL